MHIELNFHFSSSSFFYLLFWFENKNSLLWQTKLLMKFEYFDHSQNIKWVKNLMLSTILANKFRKELTVAEVKYQWLIQITLQIAMRWDYGSRCEPNTKTKLKHSTTYFEFNHWLCFCGKLLNTFGRGFLSYHPLITLTDLILFFFTSVGLCHTYTHNTVALITDF